MKNDNYRVHYEAFLKREKTLIDHIAHFAGDIKFVYYHLIFFIAWIVFNVVHSNGVDPFPFILLTLIVSLEAIFLSTFVLINQNRDTERANRRAQLDLAIDKRAEKEILEIKESLEELKKLLKK